MILRHLLAVQILVPLFGGIGGGLSLGLLFGVRRVYEDNRPLVLPYQACLAIVGRYNNTIPSANHPQLSAPPPLTPMSSYCNSLLFS